MTGRREYFKYAGDYYSIAKDKFKIMESVFATTGRMTGLHDARRLQYPPKSVENIYHFGEYVEKGEK